MDFRNMDNVSLPVDLKIDENRLKEMIGSSMKSVDSEVETIAVKVLTEPGQNYGSLLLRIDIILENGQSLFLVGKVWPPTQFLRDLFASSETFCKEINMYTLVGPVILELQLEKGFAVTDIVDILPKYYGSRINREDDENIGADENSILLLENLEKSGYRVMNRMVGLDLAHSKLALRKLAQLQALAIGLKLLNPQAFNNTIRKACRFYKVNAKDFGKTEALDQFLEYFKNIPECLPILDKVRECCFVGMKLKLEAPVPREPYATLVHNDFWVNNMMFSYKNGTVNECKILDFQGISFDSPAKDIILFLYTSTSEGLTKRHFKELLREYHNSLIQCLQKLGCNTDEFSFSSLIHELNTIAPLVLFQLLYITVVVYAEHTPDELTQIHDMSFFVKGRGETYRRKSVELLLEFNERGWLNLDSQFLK